MTRSTHICWTQSIFFIILLALSKSLAATISWIADSISITSSQVQGPGPWTWSISIASNDEIYRDTIGQFRINYNLYAYTSNYVNFTGQTECLQMNTDAKTFNTVNEATILTSNTTGEYIELSQLLSVKAQHFQKVSSSSGNVNAQYMVTFSGDPVLYLTATITTSGCANARTISFWNNIKRWNLGRLPLSTDTVIFPPNSGVVILHNSVTVQSLITNSGTFIAQSSSCPPGWVSGPGNPLLAGVESYSSEKCYRLFENAIDFDTADRTCTLMGVGSAVDSRLVHINDYEELDVVKRVCRGNDVDSAARNEGCWVGLRDKEGLGHYNWVQPTAIEYTGFRDWRRFKKDNRTVSEGINSPGELCVHIVPWQEDPLINEEGSMNDAGCKLSLPYVCQSFAKIVKYRITIKNGGYLNRATVIGGVLDIQGVGTINDVTISDAGMVYAGRQASTITVQTLRLNSGSMLVVDGASVLIKKNAWIGEAYDRVDTLVGLSGSMQPLVVFASSASNLMTDSKCGTCDASYNVTVNARTISSGSIVVDNNVAVNFKQGGDLSRAVVNTTSASSSVLLGGYAMKLSTFDAFDLTLSHRGPVIGEYLNSILAEDQRVVGVYRLVVTDYYPVYTGPVKRKLRTNVTQCIPYNATAELLASYIANFPGIKARGGVTIRRYGDGSDPLFNYGYHHRIELDGPSTDVFSWGSLSIGIYCKGIHDCGCAETKVPLIDVDGMPDCPTRYGNSSRTHPDACVIPPMITLTRFSQQGYTRTNGPGTLVIGNGVHRLPPIANMGIACVGGRGITGADRIEWNHLEADGVGTLVFTGTSWESWDSSNVLFQPEWDYERGLVSLLDQVPSFTLTANTFALGGYGSVYSAAPTANMSWNTGTWDGGVIGGRSTLYITNSLEATGTNKALRYGITLFVTAQAKFDWKDGNISLADGADMIVEGTFAVNTMGGRRFIGQAIILDVPEWDVNGRSLLTTVSGRNWHGYFDLTLPNELRGGWYENPLCGDQCLLVNQITVRQTGSVLVASHGNVGFRAPLNLIGHSTLTLGADGQVEIYSGGICGNDVIMDMAIGTVVELSGGNFLMKATCTIQGQGELLVSAGVHDLAFSIDAHITISGGKMIWPLSRGPKQTIKFNGGLKIDTIGVLEIQPFSTTILIRKDVELRDECLIQFPMIGIAIQATPSDGQDAPDSSPRGNMTVQGVMWWFGGTMRGKADINALQSLYLDGETKYIRSLAKLVNHGHAEWGLGDLIMDDNAGFLNLGYLQMRYGTDNFNGGALFKGTVIPLENGGDVYAQNFHTWDMDQGHLSFTEYVRLRTLFVSRAPKGWTAEKQRVEEVLVPL